MDLKTELIRVLDNPSRFWDAMVANLDREPRICLLTLATCKLPLSLVGWQEAVARVSTDAAARFDAAIRVLDDSFVVSDRDQMGQHFVSFRNPSVEEFISAQLDANVGFAKTVAESSPSLNQVQRIMQLGTARKRIPDGEIAAQKKLYEFAYPNINQSLLHVPTTLVGRMLEIVPVEPGPIWRTAEDVLTFVQLVGGGSLLRLPDAEPARERLSAHLRVLTFQRQQNILYQLLDDSRNAKTVREVLGDQFNDFYDNLAETALSLSDFDSLVNLDEALDRSAKEASWANAFERENRRWLESTDASDVESEREMYEKVATYLEDLSGLEDWDDLYEATRDEREGSSEPADDSWRDYSEEDSDGPVSSSGSKLNQIFERAASERGQINAMFDGLSHSHRRD